MLESRVESLLVELDTMVADYVARRRYVRELPEVQMLRSLQRQIHSLEAENLLLRQHQAEICERLREVLAQVDTWERLEGVTP